MDDTLIAAMALVISVAVAIWEMVKYLLEGGRVRVRMYAGLHSDYALFQALRWKSLLQRAKKRGGWTVEVAVLEIENLGRTAVTVSEPSLDLGRTRRWGLGRKTISPRPVSAVDACTDRSIRLEPFDRVRFVFDVWQILAPVSGEPPKRPLKLRGSLRIAGKRFRRRSPFRHTWRVVPGQLTFDSEPVEIGMAAYRAMWRHTKDDMTESHSHDAIAVALAVRKKFPTDGPAPSTDDIDAILSEVHHFGPDYGKGIVALYVARELRNHFALPSQGNIK